MADVTINSIQDLLAFASGQYGYGSSSDYLDVELGADLDFADLAVNDVPYSWGGCPGTWYINFNGKGHTIDNIYYSGTSDWGFFRGGLIYGNIENLNLTNVYVVTSGRVAGILNGNGTNSFSIKNCHVSGQLEAIGLSNNSSVCGIVRGGGSGWQMVSFCSFSGVLKAGSGIEPGGLASWANGSSPSPLVSCMINATFISSSAVYVLGTWGVHPINCMANVTVTGGGSTNILPYTLPQQGRATNCIVVIRGDSTGVAALETQNNRSDFVQQNCYIDSDQLALASIPSTSYYPTATSAQLKDASWLRSQGYPL